MVPLLTLKLSVGTGGACSLRFAAAILLGYDLEQFVKGSGNGKSFMLTNLEYHLDSKSSPFLVDEFRIGGSGGALLGGLCICSLGCCGGIGGGGILCGGNGGGTGCATFTI